MPIGNPHDYTTHRLLRTLLKLVGNEVVVGCRGPVRIDVSSRPEPDGWLAKGPDEAYLAGAPTSDDLYLVCEVADSSLDYDRETKLEIYARGGVVEYWILNVRDGEIEVHTQPRADGTYASKRVLATAETLRHERLGEIAVGTLFCFAFAFLRCLAGTPCWLFDRPLVVRQTTIAALWRAGGPQIA